VGGQSGERRCQLIRLSAQSVVTDIRRQAHRSLRQRRLVRVANEVRSGDLLTSEGSRVWLLSRTRSRS
jgi:hypothetical protein